MADKTYRVVEESNWKTGIITIRLVSSEIIKRTPQRAYLKNNISAWRYRTYIDPAEVFDTPHSAVGGYITKKQQDIVALEDKLGQARENLVTAMELLDSIQGKTGDEVDALLELGDED